MFKRFALILFAIWSATTGWLAVAGAFKAQEATATQMTTPVATAYVPTYPVTVKSCDTPVTFETKPKRAISFDTGMTEIMLALGLQDRMVGYWISGVQVGDEYQKQIANVPLVSKETWPPPSKEIILSFNPDFVFGGWGWNFSQESGVTPETLAAAGVKSYTLSESCTAAGGPGNQKPDATFESTYSDILNIGLIFGVKDRAATVVDNMRANISAVQKKIGKIETPLRGFYYGGGQDAAFTAGRYAMASKLMDAVGAKNILWNVEKDWIPSETWEPIINADPEFVLIDDTPWESAQHRIDTLESLPQLASITAIRQKRYIVLPWRFIIPGVAMDKGVAALAKALYPNRFQ